MVILPCKLDCPLLPYVETSILYLVRHALVIPIVGSHL